MIIIFPLVLAGCGSSQESQDSGTSQQEADQPAASPEISLVEVISPEFPDALLEMIEPLGETNYKDGNINFQYNIKNYQLTAQTLDADTKQCANSGKGQHIHLIVDGEPYHALYEPDYQLELEDGNHVVLSFLSRSYHESLKHYGAYVLRQFSVGEGEADPVDLTGEHMFYSRPKGEYKGADTEKVLLDFYLVNTELSASGNKVRATINGEQFLIDKWVPHFIKGLPDGENTIKLELIDGSGNPIEGPFNTVERSITLTKDSTT